MARSIRTLMRPGRMTGLPFRRNYILWLELILLVVAIACPLLVQGYELSLATKIVLFAILALTLDAVWGYAGIFDLGHAVFFGVSAYIAGLMATKLAITSAFITLPLAALAGGVLSLLFGLFLFGGRKRLGTLFVAMATLALAYIAQRVAANWYDIGAANGVANVPYLTIGDTQVQPGTGFFYGVVVLIIVTYLGFRFLMRSQFGRVLIAARMNEQRVTFLGYDTTAFKLVVYTLSGTVCGLVGALYTFHEGFVGPTLLGVDLSTQILIWVLVGGSGTLIGGLFGSLVMQYASIQLSGLFLTLWQILLGAILVVVVLLLPRGLISLLDPSTWSAWFRRGRPGPSVTPADMSDTEEVVGGLTIAGRQ